MSLTTARVRARDGLELAVRFGGSGPAVLLVHGFTGSSAAWGEPLLGRLARSCTVLAPDLIGHGDSARCHDPERYRIEAVVSDLECVLDEYAPQGAVWVGYSMGGRVTLAAAAAGIRGMHGMVLESASPGLDHDSERGRRREEDEALALDLEDGGMDAFVERWMALPLFASQRRLPAEVLDAERRRRLANDPASLAACLRGLGTGSQPSFWDVLPEIRLPVTLLTGRLDPKFEGIAEAMAGRLPNVTHRSVEGAGHAVHLEAADAWLDTVLACRRRIDDDGPAPESRSRPVEPPA